MRKKFLASLLGCGIFSLGFLQNTSASQTNVYIQNYLYPSSSYTTVTPVGYTYYIRSARELNWVSYMVTQGYNFQGCTIEIMSDLDFSNEGFMPIGTYYVPFQGTINGNGHWMRNLTLNYPGYYSIGFVGYLGYYGTINGVNISSSCRFTAYGTVGGLVGWNSGTVNHCSSSATLIAVDDFVGEIVGYNDGYGRVEDCEACVLSNHSSGQGKKVGIFAGDNAGRISNCRTFFFYPW